MPRPPDEIAALRTLAFFGLFDRGLTLEELQAYALFRPLDGVVGVVRALSDEGLVVADGDVVGLAGNPRARLLGSIRKERAAQAEPLVQRAERFARLARHLPYVRGVFLVNSLALGTNRAGSDVDLLVVGRSGRLWVARLLTTILAHVLGWRRHGVEVAGRLCLSFFLADDALDLGWMALGDDVYLACWVASARRLRGALDADALVRANTWAHALLPGLPRTGGSGERASALQRGAEWFLDRTGIGWLVDWVTARTLGRRTRRRAAAVAHHHVAGTVVTDRVQKFHDRDRRLEFRTRWRAACGPLGV